MTYKAIISDFDGTLIDEDAIINESLRDKIVEVQEKGGIFSIATGRCYQDNIFKKANHFLRLTSPQIIHSGARIIDPLTGDILWQQNINDTETKGVVDMLSYFNIPFILKKDKFFYTISGRPDESYDASYIFKTLTTSDIAGVPKIDVHAEAAKLTAVKALQISSIFEKKFTDTLLTIVRDNGWYGFEITSKKASKKAAFLVLCRMLGISPAETIVIGDSYNDLSILKAAGLKIVMGNAP